VNSAFGLQCIFMAALARRLEDVTHLFTFSLVLIVLLCSVPLYIINESPLWLRAQRRIEAMIENLYHIAKINKTVYTPSPEKFRDQIWEPHTPEEVKIICAQPQVNISHLITPRKPC
jgi:hypothetical protein